MRGQGKGVKAHSERQGCSVCGETPRSSIRGVKPGIMPNLFHAWSMLLIGALNAGVPPVLAKKLPEIDPVKFDDSLIEFRGQA